MGEEVSLHLCKRDTETAKRLVDRQSSDRQKDRSVETETVNVVSMKFIQMCIARCLIFSLYNFDRDLRVH